MDPTVSGVYDGSFVESRAHHNCDLSLGIANSELNREGLRAQLQRALLELKYDLTYNTGAAGDQIAAARGVLGTA